MMARASSGSSRQRRAVAEASSKFSSQIPKEQLIIGLNFERRPLRPVDDALREIIDALIVKDRIHAIERVDARLELEVLELTGDAAHAQRSVVVGVRLETGVAAKRCKLPRHGIDFGAKASRYSSCVFAALLPRQ